MGALAFFSIETNLAILLGLMACILLRRYLTQWGSDVPKLKRAPGAHWLWGNEKDAWAQPNGSFYTRTSNELGSAFAMKAGLFHRDIIAITDPAAVTHIFTRHTYSYVKSQIFRPMLDRLIGRSLPWAEGEEHKRQRQILAPVFTNENVKKMSGVIYGATDKLVDRLRTYIHNTSSSEPVNIVGWPSRATLDIIGSVGFGYDFKCGESDEAKAIAAEWKQIVDTGLAFPGGFVAPLVLRALPFIVDLPVKAIQAQGKIKVLIKKLASEIVDGRAGVDIGKGTDLLSTLLRLQDSQQQDVDQLLDHVVSFIVAGNETTGSTLSFALLELAKNKGVQESLRQELLSFRGSGPGGEPTYEELQTKLPYLDAVCKEVLRMYPVATNPERIALQDDVLPLRFPVKSKNGETMSSIRIKEGQLIYIPTIAINRNSTVWGDDAEHFVPERWLDPSKLPASDVVSKGISGILSFLEGPRMCIGYRLALFEFKVILSGLIRNFDFTDTGMNIVTQFSVTLQPYVKGMKSDGVQIPLFISDLHH